MKKFYFLLANLIIGLSASAQPCNVPTNLRAVGYSYNSITLDWSSGGATNWQIRFVPSGGNINLANPVNVTSKPFTIAGLNQSASYAIQVRDSCSPGFSSWTSFITISTSCTPLSLPFTANFDGAAWSPGPFTTSLGTINSCWQRFDPGGSSFWKTGPPAFVFNSGADNDHTTGNGQYIYVERSGFGGFNPDSTMMESVLFDLSTATNPQLSFWYHMFGSDIEDLRIYVSADFGLTYTEVGSISGQQQFSTSDSWKERIINLNSFANDTVRIRFVAAETTPGFNNAICIDDVSVGAAPSCPRPQNISLVSTSASSATLTWQSGGASNWQIEYGSPGFTLGNGTLLNVNSNPFTISGLSANTSYSIYLRDSCATNDLSTWSGPFTFKTLCLPLSAPYSENFDGNTFNPGTFFNDTGSINSCWSRNNTTNGYFWKTGPPSFAPFNTGPSGDHTTGSGQYLFTESNGFFSVFDTELSSPLIDLSSLTVPELTFYCHLYGTNIQSLETYVDNGSGYTLINTQSGNQQNSKADPWKEVIVSLAAYANDTIRIKFKATKSQGLAADISIDDISIAEAPSCPKPQNLSLVSTGVNSATLAWQSGGANNWNLSYGSPGFQVNNGTIVNSSTNPGTITGLSSNTTYDVYVRDSCGPGDVSVWLGPISITTRCTPATAPYFENFDGANFVVPIGFGPGVYPNCWERDTAKRYIWGVSDDVGFTTATGPDKDHTTGSGQFLVAFQNFGFNLQNNLSATLNSELVDLSALTVPQLSFWYHMFGANIDSMAVYIENGTTSTRVWSKSGQQQNSQSAPWQEAIVSLAAYANDTISVKFIAYRATNFSQAEAAIDDLRLEETPSCPKPQNLSATASTTTSVSLSWQTGGASNWQIEYGPAGFNQGNGTIITAPTNPFTVNGLNPSTAYEFYVRDSCGLADVSDWGTSIVASTLCGISPAPVLETFDNSNWQVSTNFFDPGVIDACWGRTDTISYHWRAQSGATPFFNSGPNGDHTSGSGKYIYTAFLFGVNNNTSTTFSSSQYDLSPLTAPQLRFYSHLFGAGLVKLDVEIFDGTSWNNELTISGQQQTASTDPWDEQIISLAAYANDTIQVRFIAEKTTGFSNQCNIAIDDFEIREAPSCPRPTNLQATATTTNSIDLSWVSGGATNWEIHYRVAGSTGAFTRVTATTNPFSLTGLNASTTYEIEVRDSCAIGDVSAWEGPLLARTDCGLITAPWNESFDGSTWTEGTGPLNTGNIIDNCWSRPNSNNPNFGSNSGGTTSGSTGPSGDVNGTGKYIYTESSLGSNATGQITSPEIFIPLSLTNPYLKFAYHLHGNNIVDFDIEISVSGGAFSNIFNLNGEQQTSSFAPWKFDSVALSTYAGDTIQVRFKISNNGFSGDGAIDEVSVVGQVAPCSDPTNLTFNNISTNSVDVIWNSAPPAGNSNLEYYDLSQGPGSASILNGINSPQSLSGLTPGSQYSITIYDSCGSNISAAIIDTIQLCDTVNASFTYNKSFLSVSFNSGSLNADSLYWNFAGISSSNQTNPSVLFNAPGAYPVTLFAYNACGQYDSITQVISVCDSILASFTHTLQGDTSYFDASATQNGLGFIWDLDDGFTSSGFSSTAKVKYPTGGTKNIILKVYNACGDTVSVTKTITICPPPVANWTYTILTPINSGLRVQFDGTLSSSAISYSWDFGDGSTGTGPTPIHIYATPGLFYVVELTVTNDCGAKATKRFALSEIGFEEILLVTDFRVYPNPASNVLNLVWDETNLTPKQFKLFNSQGQLALSFSAEEPNDGSYQLNVSNLSSGLYFMHLESNSGTLIKRIIIK